MPEEALPPLTGPVSVAIGVWQVVSPGAKSWKVTLPAGSRPPDTVAVSETFPPAGTGLAAVVEIDGLALTHAVVAESSAAHGGPEGS